MNIRNNRGRPAVAETETITVSKRFADNLRELAYLLDDKRPLDQLVDEHCGWVLVNLVEEEASTGGEWGDIINERSWSSESECSAFVDRVRPKFEKTAIFEVYQDHQGWQIAMFDSRYSGWHKLWMFCRKYGVDYEAARQAYLDGNLEEFASEALAIAAE